MLLPLQFNDGREVPPDWLAETVLEIVDHYGAASYETQRVEGHWRHGGVVFCDNLVKIVVDVPDSDENRQWMRAFKERWKVRLEQLDLWLVSYLIEIDERRRKIASTCEDSQITIHDWTRVDAGICHAFVQNWWAGVPARRDWSHPAKIYGGNGSCLLPCNSYQAESGSNSRSARSLV